MTISLANDDTQGDQPLNEYLEIKIMVNLRLILIVLANKPIENIADLKQELFKASDVMQNVMDNIDDEMNET
eukprot:CAMPEP_0116891086 /NCGR_PEP_ID=MMETSP0467-20121206/1561_1 /TAXON_ID=283647 /ORGANISM="Mesodinium pulex, Strain SPMC105" /LENGTH=71 /DNA_ID=CAMNT_0004559367 /DNA_START=264 /DNA_END=476 /DNA_ORIENTATION=-